MNSETLKAQARRLQTFLAAHPSHAQGLAQAKHASCLEAVAAVHGARNWNTLLASTKPAPATPAVSTPAQAGLVPPALTPDTATTFKDSDLHLNADIDAPFGRAYPRQVEYLTGRSGSGKSWATSAAIVAALVAGYHVTVLDIGMSYRHLAQAMGGTYLEAHDVATSTALRKARFAVLEFERWAPLPAALEADWATLLPYLEARTGYGAALVVDEAFVFASRMGAQRHRLTDFLAGALARGTAIRVIGQMPQDFAFLEDALPPSVETELGPRGLR